MNPKLNVAIQAVRKAGDFILKSYEHYNFFKKNLKNKKNFLINVNETSRKIITQIIQKFYPNHIILQKKSLMFKSCNPKWIINPLDGAVNFSKYFPHFSISISIEINHQTEISVIYNPVLNELFTAIRGQGAQLNGSRLRIKEKEDKFEKKIISFGFPLTINKKITFYSNLIKKFLEMYIDFRRTGSTTLDLAYIASNRTDLFCGFHLNQLEVLAGELLIKESGGTLIDFLEKNKNHLKSRNILTGTSNVIKKIFPIIKYELKKLVD